MTSNAWVVAMILNIFMGSETRAFSHSRLFSNTAHFTITKIARAPFIPNETITVFFECTTNRKVTGNAYLIIAGAPITTILIELKSVGEIPWKGVGGIGIATLFDIEVTVVQ